MLTVILVAALAATVVGSPHEALVYREKVSGLHLHAASENVTTTVRVFKNGGFVGPAALIADRYVISSAQILGNVETSTLSVKTIGHLFSWGKSVRVSNVLVHPDALMGTDVAILELAEPLVVKSAGDVAGVANVATESPLPGSLGKASAVSTPFLWVSSLVTRGTWSVLPKYCGASSAVSTICATYTDAFQLGSLLTVDDQLVGLARFASPKGYGELRVVNYVNLADPSVQKFIAAATKNSPTEAPATETPATESPATESPATESPATESPATESPATSSPTPASKPSGKSCTINVKNGLPTNEPVIVIVDASSGAQLLTSRHVAQANGLVVEDGEQLQFICPGRGNAFNINKSKQTLKAQCDDGALTVDGRDAELNELGCISISQTATREAGTCGDKNQFKLIQIGFEAGDDFLTQIENCFDGRTYDAVYSRANMTPSIANYESGVHRPQFSPSTFYDDINVNQLYVRKNQRNTVAKLLGDSALASKYITGDSLHFLARGHLSAKADYILGAQQRATFFYNNAAPQWQTFNGGNWEKLESSVRSFVVSSGRSVQVVTGTWGTATLPNKDGEETELFLQGTNKLIRVPKYYWKVVYETTSGKAAAFVGLNNPYHELKDEDVLCKDVCNEYSWLNWNLKDQSAGNGFCCDVNELRKVITTIPDDLTVRGLL